MQLEVFHVNVTDDEDSVHTENTVFYNIEKYIGSVVSQKLILSHFSSGSEETSWVSENAAVMFLA